jgi:hypothetical protein
LFALDFVSIEASNPVCGGPVTAWLQRGPPHRFFAHHVHSLGSLVIFGKSHGSKKNDLLGLQHGKRQIDPPVGDRIAPGWPWKRQP